MGRMRNVKSRSQAAFDSQTDAAKENWLTRYNQLHLLHSLPERDCSPLSAIKPIKIGSCTSSLKILADSLNKLR